MATVKTENIDFENGILFSIFKHGEVAIRETETAMLDTYDFANSVNKKIYEEIRQRYSKDKTVLSYAGFYKFVTSMPENSDEDKVKFKLAMENIAKATIKIGDINAYCKELRKLSCIRKFIKESKNSITCLDSDSLDDVIGKFEKNITDIKARLNEDVKKNIVEYVSGVDKRIEYAKDINANPTKHGMVKTGFVNFDKWIPPQSKGNLVLYQSRTNVGKSMFLMGTTIENYHRQKLKVIIITIEMNAEEYAFRIDSNITKIEHKQFSTGSIVKDPNYIEHWKKTVASFKKTDDQGDLLIYWVPENCTPAKVDAIISSNPFKPDLVIIDYAGDMKAGIKGVPEYSAAAHAEIYSRLKEIAGKHQCVIYSAQQTKRNVKKVTDESGSWSDVASHKSDIMIAVEMTEEDKTFEDVINGKKYHGRRTITIVKGRNVPRLRTYVSCDFERMFWYEKEFFENDDTNGRPYKLYDNGYAEYDTSPNSIQSPNNIIVNSESSEVISDELLNDI